MKVLIFRISAENKALERCGIALLRLLRAITDPKKVKMF